MNCSYVREKSSEYLDGDLDSGTASQIDEHLRTCDACQKELDMLRRTISLVEALPHRDAPAGVRDAIRARLAASPRMRQPAGPRSRKAVYAASVVAAVAAVLLLGLILNAYFQGVPTPGPQVVSPGSVPPGTTPAAEPQPTVAGGTPDGPGPAESGPPRPPEGGGFPEPQPPGGQGPFAMPGGRPPGMDMEGIPLGVEGEGGMGPPSPIVPGQIYIGPRNEYGFQTPGPAGLNRDPGAAPRPTDPSTTVHRRIVLTTQDMPRAQADMDRVLGMCQARVSTQSLPGEGTLYTVLVPPQRVNALIQGLKQSNALRLGSDEPLKPIDTGEWVGIQIQVSPPR